MSTLATLFVVVLLLNLVPAFAPPTWMAMSWVGFNVAEVNPFLLAVVAAGAATIGRLILATFARSLVRGRLMRESDRQNIEVVEAWLKKRKKLTAGAFFLYALGPFPSNYLFIAYGLSGLPLGVIGAAFFAGRTISYSIWAHLGRLASTYVDPEFQLEGGYLSGYFVVTQIALLGFVYIITKLDWKMLIGERKLKWRRAMKKTDVGGRGHTAKH
jgi:membrane protein DedA with SNARE-associated domain